MLYKILLALCFITNICSAATDLEHADHSLPPLLDGSSKKSQYQSIVTSDSIAITPLENTTPSGHPVLRDSRIARNYVKCSTICCFLSRGWFQTGAFIASVATCAIAGVAYGVSDPDIKNTLNLTLVILTAGSAALKKFENYATAAVNDQEDEYKMFDLAPARQEKNEPPRGAAIV